MHPIKREVNYKNPCAPDKFDVTRQYLVSHVNQKNSFLQEHTTPLISHFGKVNNAASTQAPHIYYSGLEGGCLQGQDPDVNPMGGNWTNNCTSSTDKDHSYDLSSFFKNAPGVKSKFDDEQKSILESLNEVIPGFNQLHISNSQFCKNDNNWYFVPDGMLDRATPPLHKKIEDGIYNPTSEDCKENDILCKYFQCPGSNQTGAKCRGKDNPLYVMKDVQKYKQTLDGQYLDGIGTKSFLDKVKSNKEWGGKYNTGVCISPGDSNCTPQSTTNSMEAGAQGQGGPCNLFNDSTECLDSACFSYDGYDNDTKDCQYDTSVPSGIYPNAPVLTTEGTCYYAGVGATGPANSSYQRGDQYHDRYIIPPNLSSVLNKWNETGATAYGMLKWNPQNDGNQFTEALDSVLSAPARHWGDTNRSFDLSPYKIKCGESVKSAPGKAKITDLTTALKGTNPLKDAGTLICPLACPLDEKGKCLPRAVCSGGAPVSALQQQLGLPNYATPNRPCPVYCPAGSPTLINGGPTTRQYCMPQKGLYKTICPPMGTNYSIVGKNLGMIEAPKHNSAFFHNHYVQPTVFQQALKDGVTNQSSPGSNDLHNIFTSAETIWNGAPGGKSLTGFDKQGFYQMPQGENEAEEILCEYQVKMDQNLHHQGKNSVPNFVDILTDPRQVAWMWEGTADSGIPPKDHATQINTLGLYIRGKPTFNPQKIASLDPNMGSIKDVKTCSPWQDQMVDVCMNHEVQNKNDCFRPAPNEDGDLKSTWNIRYPLDIPPPGANPATNTTCPILISKPQQDTWRDYHGIPHESEQNAAKSEYYTGKYCKDWYHTMADTYSAFTDKSSDIAAEKFNKAAEKFCKKTSPSGHPIHQFNFECGCINADPSDPGNLHSDVVAAMMQGGPQSIGQEQKYCYLGACDVGSVGSLQHDRFVDPRYGSWSFPEAPVIPTPKSSPCTQTRFRIPCYSPSPSPAPPDIPCWRLNDEKHHYPPPVAVWSPNIPPVARCPVPLCSSSIAQKNKSVINVNCNGYVDSSLQKCPNFTCDEMVMVEGSTLENDKINSGISICQRHGTNISKRWKYDEASSKCIYTEAGASGPGVRESCDNTGACKVLKGNTNDPYMYPSFDACTKATTLTMSKLPRTGAPPPYPKQVFQDKTLKWSCNNKKCISAMGVGEYTTQGGCESFCSGSIESSPILMIIIILICIGIFAAFVIFAIRKYKYKPKAELKRYPNVKHS